MSAGAVEVVLGAIAYGRSGDKGGNANIGVVARRPEWYAAVERELTAARVQEFFAERAEATTRFEWPSIHAVNFVLRGILGKGGTSTLRLDPQGKALADAVLSMRVHLTSAEANLLGDNPC